MSHVILVGGLPGSGKTTIAETLHTGLGAFYKDPMIVAADDFFYVGDDEPHCEYSHLQDPGSLKGTDYARYRVGRSVREALGNHGWSYKFEPELIAQGHIWCQEQVRNELARSDRAGIVVHNTFTQRWEMEPYLKLARDFSARVTVTRLYDGGCTDEELARRNSHGVPLEFIQKMRANWEENWGASDPTPPWEREAGEE
jgi:hypothetical protein